MKQVFFKNLEAFRKKIKISSTIESKEINYVLKWLEKQNSKNLLDKI